MTPCPYCGQRTKVLKSDAMPRTIAKQLRWPGGYWRLRECVGCHVRFDSQEKFIDLDAQPIERSRHDEPPRSAPRL